MNINSIAPDSGVTITDLFCGCGGSSEGARKAGAQVYLAMNHWKLAVDSHNENHPETNHECANISETDARRYRRTVGLIGSPECTKHSNAGGLKRKNAAQGDLFQGKAIDPSVIRSRATMWDIVRFTEVHRYEFVIVENVVEVMTTWDSWKPWLYAMANLGYKHKCVFLNAQFAHGFHHGHFIESFAPQSRDRIYVVFWKKGNKAPKLDIRPQAPCLSCCKNVGAVQTWKKQKFGKYGIKNGQYVYRCPECHSTVTPYYYAALNCLDFSQSMVRIRDRELYGMKPLADNTLARIQYGLNKGRLAPVLLDQRNQFSRHVGTRVRDAATDTMNTQSTGYSTYLASAFTFDMAHSHATHSGKIRDPFQAMNTQTTQASSALVTSQAVEVFLQANRDCSPMQAAGAGVLHTQTTALQEYVIGAPGFISQQYGNTKDGDSFVEALSTTTATNKSALIMPPSAILTARGDCDLAEMTKTLPTQVAAGIQNWVVSQQPFLTPYHGGSHQAASVMEPTYTVPTNDSLAMVSGQHIDVMDCYFRMLQPHETLQAQGFGREYVVLGNKDQQQKQIGNANPPPTMELLTRLCLDSLA
jgi:DNA (cytosine-5)-methyltransferase 1